jgi:hypothetical protein
MPFYQSIKSRLKSQQIVYYVSGSQYGLVTNAIHYIDHISYLTDCSEFTIETSGLIPELVPCKRQGFVELDGTLIVNFANGSIGLLTCFPSGNAPMIVEIIGVDIRFISRESEGVAWCSDAESNWEWSEHKAEIPFQSQMTTKLVEHIIKGEPCGLVDFEGSVAMHEVLLESLRKYMNDFSATKFEHYPFT